MILLDTNVVSELMRLEPAAEVMAWFASQPADQLETSAVTEAEILHGLSLLPDGKRRRQLEESATRVFREIFAGRVRPFDSACARRFGEVAARRRENGRPVQFADAAIAAIAREAGAAVATRDIADFEHSGVRVINPWTRAGA